MPTRFVILGTQRTGTTWIRTTLNSHPGILALGEVFLYSHGRFPLRRKAGLDVEDSYRRFIEASVKRRVLHHLARPRVVEEYLDALYSRRGHEAIGFKLMRTHCRQFPSVVPYLLERHIPAIHVVRRNVLKTLISRETARQRKLFHARKGVPVAKIRIDAAALPGSLESIDADNAAWERIFGDSVYLKLSYESFVENRERELERIYDFLAVPSHPEVESDLVKLNPESLQDILLNYDEVAASLKGTRFEWCLQPVSS